MGNFMKYRKTKIICTIGPTSRDLETVKQLLIEGMNVVRFNFSHGDHAYHKEGIDVVREASRQTSLPVALLLDTKGPEIRTGEVKDGKTIKLVNGNKITITTDQVMGTEKVLSISYKKLPDEISAGKHIFIADGLVDLEVESVTGNEINCIIRSGGEIGSRKNVNVVGVKTSLPAMTQKDIQDIIFGVEQNMDFVAASFIRKPGDVKEIRSLIDVCDSNIQIISKIEDEEGIENIDEIIRVSNGIMVARGDLGVQIPTESIPIVQKRIISKCNKANKPVITATQMLDSMINNPKPTRAESTDVANAIFDGTDAIMLSGETANGKYPVLAVKTMHKIGLEIESSQEYKNKWRFHYGFSVDEALNNVEETIAKGAFHLSSNIHAAGILTPTLHGNTPKLISKFRPPQKIIAVTPSEQVQRMLMLYWGVYPIVTEFASNSDDMLDNALQSAQDKELIDNFDKVVILAGVPLNSPHMLNMMRVHIVCKVLGKGQRGFGDKIVTGKVVKAKNGEDAINKIKGDGTEILVTKYLDKEFKPVLKKIKGYILEEFSDLSWNEITKENEELVVIAGAPNVMNALEDEKNITMDSKEKLIYEGEMKKSKMQDYK